MRTKDEIHADGIEAVKNLLTVTLSIKALTIERNMLMAKITELAKELEQIEGNDNSQN